MEFEVVVGLEVHAQLRTQTKIFCGCSTLFGAPPNSHTCPVCLGLPGVLPVLNQKALAMAVKSGLALNCHINQRSVFARKNYFYPDLPKGYQISQFELPLCEHGFVEVLSGERLEAGNIVNYRKKRFGITRVHLEEDAGKSQHLSSAGGGDTYVNLNRAGVPLIEIVSEPDFRNSQQAYDYLTHLRKTLLYLGVCDGNMEEGSLRCDANISVRPVGQTAFGTKIEIKNLNSFRFLQKALDYEAARQTEIVRDGGTISQETRLWDEEAGKTLLMRSKEEAHDYRYFPDPDLLPVVVTDAMLDDLRALLPELPEARCERFTAQYGLPGADALLLTSTRPLAEYFEELASRSGNPRAAANWVTGELMALLKRENLDVAGSPVSAAALAELIGLVDSGRISGKMAKELFEEMASSGSSPGEIVASRGLEQLSDEGELARLVDETLASNPREVEGFRAGKEKLLGFFVGQIMQATRGKANPKLVNELLLAKLKEDRGA